MDRCSNLSISLETTKGRNFRPIPKLTETVKLKSVIFLHIMSNTKPFFSIPLISIMSISYKFTKFEVKEIKKRSERK